MKNDDVTDPASVGRHSITEEVRAGGMGSVILDDGETHHLRAEVDIEVSGVDSDRPHSYALLEAIERTVTETLEDFDGAGGRVELEDEVEERLDRLEDDLESVSDHIVDSHETIDERLEALEETVAAIDDRPPHLRGDD